MMTSSNKHIGIPHSCRQWAVDYWMIIMNPVIIMSKERIRGDPIKNAETGV
jgi:hypothetical protein